MSVEPALFQELREKQKYDPKLEKIREAKAQGRAENFEVDSEGGLKFMSRWCVPNDLELKKKILEEAHCTPYSVHPGGDKLYKDLKANFWWPCMKREVAEFVARCLVCQKIKIEHQRPGVWVIVDRLTKVARFIPMKNTWSMEELVEAYANEIIRLHGVPKDIVSDRDPSSFLISGLLCKKHLSLNLVEFSYNNSYHASIQMAPYEALYGRKCRSPTCWSDISDSLVLGPVLIQDTVEQVKVI
ncbi:uncharacterized protein LOC130590069 [Beta vulgaris subsp. vulgaris]|uniref:uncharacterized protein LOC130590069 n=1 Tax=Beta vulgaris subsp. vulgaris TaxID=3555 RepID=UPI002549A3F0|nr:uncharacterized protein LOC130590069 [Beta vulgaris subsp. vulgaris]